MNDKLKKGMVALEAALIATKSATPEGVPADAQYVAPDEEVPDNAQVHSGPGGATYITTDGDEDETGDDGDEDVKYIETEYGPVPDTDGPIPPDMRDEPIGSDSHPVLWKRPEGEEELNEYIEEISQTEWIQEGEQVFEEAFHGDDNTENEHTDDEGNWDPEREALHDEWTDDLLNDDAATEEGEEPIGMVLLGPPGAGKGWWQEQAEEGAYGETGEFVEREFTAISSDRTKEPIPEYDETNAAEVHDEASKMAKENLAPKALEDEHNMIVDKVATSPDSTMKMIESMKEKGYDIRASFVGVPEEKSIHNAVSRYYEEGRYTPLEYAQSAGEKSRDSFDHIVEEAGIPDEKVGRFDNDVEWGDSPEAEQVGEDLLKLYEFLKRYKVIRAKDEHDGRETRHRRDGRGNRGVDGRELRRGSRGRHGGDGGEGEGRVDTDELAEKFVEQLFLNTPDGVPDDADYVAPDEDVPDDATVHTGPGGATYVTYDGEDEDSESSSGPVSMDPVEFADNLDDATRKTFEGGFEQTVQRLRNKEVANNVAENLYVSPLERQGMIRGQASFIDNFIDEGGTIKLDLKSGAPPSTINHELAHGIAELHGYGITDDALDLANNYGMGADNPPDRHYEHHGIESADDLKFKEERSPERPEEVQRLIEETNEAMERQYEKVETGHPMWKNFIINDTYSATNAHETLALTHESLSMTPGEDEEERDVENAREGIESLVRFHDGLLKAYLEVFEPSDWAKEQIEDVNREWGDEEIDDLIQNAMHKVSSCLPLASELPDPEREEVEEMSDKFLERLLKNRVYLDDPSDAPDGALVRQGRSGRWYYDTSETQRRSPTRIYVSSPEKAPDSVTVRGGKNGGYFYYRNESPRGQY